MSQWYFVDDGKACGPLGEEEVLAAVEEGRLGPLDLIFQEGSEKWLPARDVDEFREIFRAKDQDVDAQPTWVLLRKKPKAQGAGYVQSGPFSSNELREKIEAGEVDYSDFVWKEGMKAWRKLIDSKEFKKIFKKIPAEMLEAQTITNVSIQPELPGEELLKDVMQGKIKKPVMEFAEQGQEMPPLEAEGPDLTKEEVPPVFEGDEAPPAPTSPETEEFLKERTQKEQQLKAGTKGEIPKGPVVAKRATLGDEIKEALPKAVPSLPVGLFMTLVAIIFLATGAWLVYSSLPSKEEKEAAFRQAELNRQQLKKREEERARQEQREQERAAKEAAAAAAQPSEPEPPPEPPKPKEWPRVEPTYIRISPKDLAGGSPAVEFTTDGSHHFPIEIKMTGEAGQILNRRSYWRQWALRTEPDKPRILNLAALRLGEGTYQIEAVIGKKAARTEFFVGKKVVGSTVIWINTESALLCSTRGSAVGSTRRPPTLETWPGSSRARLTSWPGTAVAGTAFFALGRKK